MLEQHPKDAPARRKLAEIYRKQKKYDQAIKQLKLAIEINPNYEPAYIDLADSILEVRPRNRLEARLIYEDMLKRFGKKVEYLSRICDLAAKEGQHKTAEMACKQTLQMSPSDPIALITLGHLIRDQAEFQKADEYFTKLLQEHSNDPQVAAACGDYFKERRLLSKAFEAFEKATESDQSSYEHFIKAGALACEMSISDKCYYFFEKSCAFSKDPRPEIRKSLNLIKSTISPEARNKFDQLILKCKPNDSI
jgi:tetratricopeptide (TPR) repeat protein